MTTTARYTYTATEESVSATEKGQIELKVKKLQAAKRII